MSHISMNVLFTGGFSAPKKLNNVQIDKYLKSFTVLTSQVREEVATVNQIQADQVDPKHLLLSTTVEQGSNSKLIMENCGTMLGVLESTKDNDLKIDERTLAKLNALLDAAVEQKLSVIYKTEDYRGPNHGQRQELIILSHFSSDQAPQTTQIQTMFGEASDTSRVEIFSDKYSKKVQQMEKFWVNPITQDVENTVKKHEIDSVKLSGIKDNKKGSSDDEGQDAILDEKTDRDERGRIGDQAEKRRLEDERVKDRQDIIADRNEAYRDGKQSRRLDQASQKAHGEKVEKRTD